MASTIYDIKRDAMLGTSYKERKVLEEISTRPWLYHIITQGPDGSFYLMGGRKIVAGIKVNPGDRPSSGG